MNEAKPKKNAPVHDGFEWAGAVARVRRGAHSSRTGRRAALLGMLTAAYVNSSRGPRNTGSDQRRPLLNLPQEPGNQRFWSFDAENGSRQKDLNLSLFRVQSPNRLSLLMAGTLARAEVLVGAIIGPSAICCPLRHLTPESASQPFLRRRSAGSHAPGNGTPAAGGRSRTEPESSRAGRARGRRPSPRRSRGRRSPRV